MKTERATCLVKLYDYLSLAQNPIAARLGESLAGAERAETVRRKVFAAIDELKPIDGAPLSSRGGRLHQILSLRYIEQQPTNETPDAPGIERTAVLP